MTVFGDLETSELHERPAAGREVITQVVPVAEHPTWYDRIWQRVREEVAQGRQAFVVCPRIGEDDDLEDIGAISDEEAVQTASVLGALRGAQRAATHRPAGRAAARPDEQPRTRLRR